MRHKALLWTLALTAFTRHADAQSSVTIYGNMDAALTYGKRSDGTSLPGGGTVNPGNNMKRLDSSVGPGSRLGFRGTEPLGDGLSANFVLEMGFGIDTGALQQGGLAFGRQAFVGLSSSGSYPWVVALGRQYSPLGQSIAGTEPTTSFFWGNVYTNVGLGTYESIGGPAGTQNTGRIDNSILYQQTFGPVTAKVLYGLGNELSGRKSGRVLSPALQFDSGQLRLSAAAAWTKSQDGAIVSTAEPETMKAYTVGARYDFGPAKAFVGYYMMRDPTLAANRSAAFRASSFAYLWNKMQVPWVGISIPLAAHSVSLTAQRIKYDLPAGPGGVTKTLSALYEYSLSKRTSVYATCARSVNNAYAKTALTATVVGLPGNGYDADYSAISLGIRHSF